MHLLLIFSSERFFRRHWSLKSWGSREKMRPISVCRFSKIVLILFIRLLNLDRYWVARSTWWRTTLFARSPACWKTSWLSNKPFWYSGTRTRSLLRFLAFVNWRNLLLILVAGCFRCCLSSSGENVPTEQVKCGTEAFHEQEGKALRELYGAYVVLGHGRFVNHYALGTKLISSFAEILMIEVGRLKLRPPRGNELVNQIPPTSVSNCIEESIAENGKVRTKTKTKTKNKDIY